MSEFWSNYWWIIVLFIILIGTGGIGFSRSKNSDGDRNP